MKSVWDRRGRARTPSCDDGICQDQSWGERAATSTDGDLCAPALLLTHRTAAAGTSEAKKPLPPGLPVGQRAGR